MCVLPVWNWIIFLPKEEHCSHKRSDLHIPLCISSPFHFLVFQWQERVNTYFSAPVTIWEGLRQWKEYDSIDVARSVHALGTLFIGCSFILPSLPPTLACEREWQLKWTIKHPRTSLQCAEGGSRALRWMDSGGFWAGERQDLIFMGPLNSHVLWTYESGEVSSSHQLWTISWHLSKPWSLPNMDDGTEPENPSWTSLT